MNDGINKHVIWWLTMLCLYLCGCRDTPSSIADRTPPQVWAQPAGGIFDRLPQPLELLSTKSATIYYTLDGSRPNKNAAVYKHPLNLEGKEVTVRFIARDHHGNPSPEQVERYRQHPNAPQIELRNHGSVRIGPGQRVRVMWTCQRHCGHFQAVVGAGDAEQGSSLAEGRVQPGQDMQIEISADRLPTPIARLWIQVTSPEGVFGAASQPIAVDRTPPRIQAWPGGGTYSKSPDVALITDEAGTVYYTTDGASPTRDATLYQAPIRLNGDTTLSFMAVDQFGNQSAIQSETYRIQSDAPQVRVQQFPGFDLGVRANQQLTWQSSRRGRYLLSANGQPLIRGRVERNDPMRSIVQGWALKRPHNRFTLSVTDEAGHEGSVSWHIDTVVLESFAKDAVLDHEATTAAYDATANRVTLPTGPLPVGTYNARHTSRGVASSGRYAYLANTRAGLQVVDIARPATPRLVGHFDMYGEPKALAKYGQYIYLAADTSDLQILDVANPEVPILVGHQRLEGRATAIVIHGTRAYVGTHEHGLYLYDLTAPRHPRLLARVPLAMPVIHLAATATHIYVAGFSEGVAIIDITSANPTGAVTNVDTRSARWRRLGRCGA